MNKILTVARREYTAAVRTKAFLISTLLMPLLMFGGVAVQRATQKMVDSQTYRVAIIDRTTGAKLAEAVKTAAKARNAQLHDASTGKMTGPEFDIEIVPPANANNVAAADAQRLELSDRARRKDLLAFVEIGPKVTEANLIDLVKFGLTAGQAAAATQPTAAGPSPTASIDGPSEENSPMAMLGQLDKLPDDAQIRYYTSQPTLLVFRNWFQQALLNPIMEQRFARLGIDPIQLVKIGQAMWPPPYVVDRGMARKDAKGAITYEAKNANVIVNTLVPTILVALMFIAVMNGASPLVTNIIEEKQLRIAELLLGGLRPSELMLGKLLGGAAVAITLAAVYFAGIFYAAAQLGFLQYVRTETILWFILFTIVGVMTYGSLFIAAGAAVTTMKEAQATLTPVMIVVAMPFFVLTNIVQYPTGTLAKVTSYFPITAPSIAIVRAAIPNGATRLELAMSAVSAIAGMLIIIWIAGRVFRAGMLLTSKPASIKEALGWILRG